MKKLIYFVLCLLLLLLVSYNGVYAQTSPRLPVAPSTALYYDTYDFVQENVNTYEYMVTYYLPYRFNKIIGHSDYVFFIVHTFNVVHGVYSSQFNSYVLEEQVIETDRTEFYFRFTINKSTVDNVYSNYPEGIERMFKDESNMYLDYRNPNDVMKNFLFAEPNFENGYEDIIGVEKYYVYLGARVYLPDGTTAGLTSMPDVITDRPDLFDGYDFVAISFNLSPRARFWSPSIYPSSYVSGLSYVVYDLVAKTTIFYDYLGNVVYSDNRIMYIDNPQFYIPETEAMQYREKAAYEEGKAEGYRQGREEGIRTGKRQMQEEMQQVIDNLTEYYEEEVRKAYIRGRNEADFENLDMFGYLQALFGEQGLGRLLRLELLPGVSLGAVIMIPLAFWLVSFIMRWFR
ncbi:MAG: hypothetical protein QXI16_04975 [Sulfolobaceae archaeon]